MSELLLNLDLSASPACGHERPSGGKHRAFRQRRAALERRGLLRPKQNRLRTARASPPPAGDARARVSARPPAGAARRRRLHHPRRAPEGKGKGKGKCVAIDCEMVGTGPCGRSSELARCSIVSYRGHVVYDRYIQPANPITDYRTRWSGVHRRDMRNATPFKQAQSEIVKILRGKIVVGHAVHNDFKALDYFHCPSLTRDTAKIPLLNQKAGFSLTESASLKRLAKQLLNREIQVGRQGHSSVEDALATMDLYKLVEDEFEQQSAEVKRKRGK